RKGFGFIEQEGGDDVFVHYREIRGDGFKTLNEGQRVEFTLTTRDKGPAAEDVSTID
ncbi:MAG: cold shock domain-containing protein, partial [Arenicellales bacterium]